MAGRDGQRVGMAMVVWDRRLAGAARRWAARRRAARRPTAAVSPAPRRLARLAVRVSVAFTPLPKSPTAALAVVYRPFAAQTAPSVVALRAKPVARAAIRRKPRPLRRRPRPRRRQSSWLCHKGLGAASTPLGQTAAKRRQRPCSDRPEARQTPPLSVRRFGKRHLIPVAVQQVPPPAVLYPYRRAV